MNNIVLKPWVGEYYNESSKRYFKKRILILGESLYGFDEGDDDAISINMKKFLDGYYSRWTGTFRKFERSLVGHDTNLFESKSIWNSVVFYNYLQTSMDKPRQSPSYNKYADSEGTFFDVLEKYKPDVMIVWGVTRMYWNLPYKGWTKGTPIDVDGFELKNGTYTLDSGHVVKTLWVYHPSTAYDWIWWHKAIEKFIEDNK